MKSVHIKTIALLLTLLSITLTSCDFGVTGNGNVEERTENIKDFTQLEIEGNFDVFLTQAKEPGLRIEADENLQDIIRVRQDGDRLKIECDEHILRAKKKSLHISFTDLAKLELVGAVDLRGETPIEVTSLRIQCSGAIDMDLELLAERLRLDVSGAANCDLEGQVEEVSLELSGAGDFNAIDLRADKMTIVLSGAAKARVYATEELNVVMSGAGSVKYKGDPEIRKTISGIGSLRKY